MAGKYLQIQVKPSVIKWARETIGLSVEKVAGYLGTSKNIVESWENGSKYPTLTQLKKIAKYFKRPLAVFFLPEPPKEPALPGDFRTLPGEKRVLSKKTLLAIRQARRMQNLAKELSDETTIKPTPKIGIASIDINPEKLANKARTFLDINIETQSKWKNNYIALENWKKAFEKAGILVSELSMPASEARGFSIMDKEFPSIIISRSDSVAARIFSLFHEYAHLLLGKSGILDSKNPELLSEEGKLTEKFCNHFAGAFLLPEQAIKKSNIFLSHIKGTKWTDDEIKNFAKKFNVSKEVIVRRFLIIGLVTEKFYKYKREQYQKEYEELKKKSKGGRCVPAKTCLRENGIQFTKMVFDSFGNNAIGFSDISDYLSTKPKYIPEIQKTLRKAQTA